MAIPKTLKKIDEKKAKKIILTKNGEWEGQPFNSDYVYEGRMTKYGRRYEMIRATMDYWYGKITYEHGVVSM